MACVPRAPKSSGAPITPPSTNRINASTHPPAHPPAPAGDKLRTLGLLLGAGGGYAAWAGLPLQQALNGFISVLVFNIIYDLLLRCVGALAGWRLLACLRRAPPVARERVPACAHPARPRCAPAHSLEPPPLAQ